MIFRIFILLSFFSYTQENELFIGKKYRSIADFVDQKKERDFTRKCEKSTAITSFLKLNSLFIKFDEGNVIGNGEYLIGETSICRTENDVFDYGERLRYIFLEKRQDDDKILLDTLKMPISIAYSPCLLDYKKKEYGICIGVYHIFSSGDEYFEFSGIYKISEREKLELLPLTTTIYDCHPPGDYDGPMEDGAYTFGIKGGKKLTRYWYEK